jgi:AraC-like DNA-binding protein
MRSSPDVDVLTDLLERSRARGAAFSSTTAHGRWGLTFPGSAPLSVHALVQGEAHLWSANGGQALHVFPGDVVLVREHTPHHLAWRAGGRCVPLAEALPDTLRLRPAAGSTLRATMDLLAGEMLRDDPGQQTLLDRLLDVALVQILRAHFSTATATAPGLFRASGDARIEAALQALHTNPGHQWTVAELAEHALLSRSAFARRFTELLGVPPLTYLNDWRMALARERLRDSDARLASIGTALGYASEFSFAAAFKRHHGTAPGRWRREAHREGFAA